MNFAALYHRSQKPWVYQVSDGKIRVMLRLDVKDVPIIKVFYKDAMGGHNLDDPSTYKSVLMRNVGSTKLHNYYEAELSLFTKRYRYVFVIESENEEHYFGENGLHDKNKILEHGYAFSYSYWDDENFLNTPKWFRTTNWYQIFPDRFCRLGETSDAYAPWDKEIPNWHEFYGGNFRGITSKLEYIRSLGFDGIYLTPIFESNSAHRYNTNDYYRLDPILGTEEDFKELIAKAKSLGIKIMLDAVFNHIGSESTQWLDVLSKGIKSQYYDWFRINDIDKTLSKKYENFSKEYPYETFAFSKNMPRINWSNIEARKYLLGAIEKWTKFGIDGWRLDVSFEPPMNFWIDVKKTIDSINKDVVVIGEVWWDSLPWLESYAWHGVMNYPLRECIINLIESNFELSDLEKFKNQYNEISLKYTPEQNWGLFNLLSSHDTPRLITTLKDDVNKYKFAMELLYLFPGSISTYYGEEIGRIGEMDPDNRRPMRFGESDIRFDLREFFKQLNKSKATSSANADIFDRTVAKIEDGKLYLKNTNNIWHIANGQISRKAK